MLVRAAPHACRGPCGWKGASGDVHGRLHSRLPTVGEAAPPWAAGMGDVVTLVEKAEEAVNADEAAELAKRMMTGGWGGQAGHGGGGWGNAPGVFG